MVRPWCTKWFHSLPVGISRVIINRRPTRSRSRVRVQPQRGPLPPLQLDIGV
jgi:hypothetical protein